EHRRARVARRRHGGLRPAGEPAPRLRRRSPPLPRLPPRPDGAAGGARGVAPGGPRLPDRRRCAAARLAGPPVGGEPGAGLVSIVGERRMLIDGRLVDAEGGATFANVDPATEEVLGP